MTLAAVNTDRELWREREGDAYAPSIFVTVDGGIGISVGGTTYVMPAQRWHRLADEVNTGKSHNKPETSTEPTS